MMAEHGYVWFLPAWFTEQWWDTDKHNAAFPAQKVPCTSAEMLSAVQGHFVLTTAYLGEENSEIVGNCTVRNWLEAYIEHLEALVSFVILFHLLHIPQVIAFYSLSVFYICLNIVTTLLSVNNGDIILLVKFH